MKGLPSGYSKDLQEDKEALFDADDTWSGCLRAAAAVMAGLRLRADVCARAAAGLLLATDVADYLVARGLPFRDAHEVVGALVRRLLDEGRGFEDLSPAEWRTHSPLFADDVAAVVDPRRSVARKRTPQSTNPDAVAAALEVSARLGFRGTKSAGAEAPDELPGLKPRHVCAAVSGKSGGASAPPPQNLNATPSEPRQKWNPLKPSPVALSLDPLNDAEVADVTADPDVLADESHHACAEVEPEVVLAGHVEELSRVLDLLRTSPTPPTAYGRIERRGRRSVRPRSRCPSASSRCCRS